MYSSWPQSICIIAHYFCWAEESMSMSILESARLPAVFVAHTASWLFVGCCSRLMITLIGQFWPGRRELPKHKVADFHAIYTIHQNLRSRGVPDRWRSIALARSSNHVHAFYSPLKTRVTTDPCGFKYRGTTHQDRLYLLRSDHSHLPIVLQTSKACEAEKVYDRVLPLFHESWCWD